MKKNTLVKILEGPYKDVKGNYYDILAQGIVLIDSKESGIIATASYNVKEI